MFPSAMIWVLVLITQQGTDNNGLYGGGMIDTSLRFTAVADCNAALQSLQGIGNSFSAARCLEVTNPEKK
jgi:hypothetical protein